MEELGISTQTVLRVSISAVSQDLQRVTMNLLLYLWWMWTGMTSRTFSSTSPSQRERARRVQQVGMFPSTVFQGHMKIHLMTLYPGQPDMMWDYPAFWTQNERHGFTVFCDIIIRGMYLNNWGTFVEQWFIYEDLRENQPGPYVPWTDA